MKGDARGRHGERAMKWDATNGAMRAMARVA